MAETPTEPDDGRVAASTIVAGDRIWIPNSRHPQEVTSVVTGEPSPGGEDAEPNVRLIVGDTTWLVPESMRIRKEQ